MSDPNMADLIQLIKTNNIWLAVYICWVACIIIYCCGNKDKR